MRPAEIHTASLRNTTRTREGWLRGEVECARVGVLPYPQPDGTVRWEYTPPEELFSAETLASLCMLPVTNGHPDVSRLPDGTVDPERNGLVNARNADILSVGCTGEQPIRDGDVAIRCAFSVHDESAVFDVENGRNEVSMGYTYTLEVAPPGSKWNGKEYTHIKRNIRFNHLALVDVARIGPTAKIHLDGITVAVGIDGWIPEKPKESTMPKIKLENGIEYEAPAEVCAEITRLSTRIGADGQTMKSVTEERDSLKAKLAEAEARIAGFDGEIKKAKAEAKAEIKARESLMKDAALFLGADALTGLDEAPDIEVMKKALGEGRPKFSLDGKTDEQIKAAYDAMVEAKKETADDEDEDEEEKKKETGGDGSVIGYQRKAMFGGNRTVATDSSEDPRQVMLNRNRSAWKRQTPAV